MRNKEIFNRKEAVIIYHFITISFVTSFFTHLQHSQSSIHIERNKQGEEALYRSRAAYSVTHWANIESIIVLHMYLIIFVCNLYYILFTFAFHMVHELFWFLSHTQGVTEVSWMQRFQYISCSISFHVN